MAGQLTGTNAAQSDPFRQTKEWKLGDAAQTEWARMIARKGFVVLPTYGMEGVDAATKAPMLFSSDGLLIAPDLLLMRPDIGAFWQDVKGKTKPTWRRTRTRWEHGCDYALAVEYRRVQEQSGAKMFIIIKELESPSNAFMDSPLTQEVVWLSIALDEAFLKGSHRDDWPGGKADPSRRGRRRMGGLLWARNDMKVIDVAAF